MKQKDTPIIILMAEDDADDRFLAADALKEARVLNEIRFVVDGEELMDYLCRRGQYADPGSSPRPGLLLVDLNMPKKDGREAIQEIKKDPDLRRIPLVVLTTSSAEEDIIRSYDFGVAGYITKPVSFDGLVDVMKVIGKYWFEIVELP
jgi:CheY-like chemotaxis protein